MYSLTGYYNLREVCELTTLSEWTIRRMEADGRFPKRKKMSPRRIGFLKKEVQRWLALRGGWQPNDTDGIDDDG
jgi:predicted DNA-binding transcriptional regulator AlpA